MIDVETELPIIRNAGGDTTFAANPFLAGSHIRPNAVGEPAIEAAWKVSLFTLDKAPLDKLIFLSGNFSCEDPLWRGRVRLDLEVSQQDRAYKTSFLIRDDEIPPVGIAFINDGTEFEIRMTLTAEAVDLPSQALFLVLPLAIQKPVHESVPALFDLGDVALNRDEKPGKSLTSANQGGLMNRLVPMLSTILVAEHGGRRPQVLWGPNDHCAATFIDLFDTGIDRPVARDAIMLAVDHEIHAAYVDDPKPIPIDTSATNLIVHAIWPLLTQPEIPHGHGDLGAIFNRLHLSKAIETMLAPFDEVDFSHTVALHIRRPYPGGAFAEQENAKFKLGLDVFIELIEDLQVALPWLRTILLCTNDLGAEAELRSRFGDLIFTFRKSTIDNTRDPVAVQEAMVDMILMSRCPLLFSQETTSFGRFAHIVGQNTMVAVASPTTGDTYALWHYSRGEHVDSIVCPRGDTLTIGKTMRDWMPSWPDTVIAND